MKFWLFVKSGGKKIFLHSCEPLFTTVFSLLSRGHKDSIPKVLKISISVSISLNYFNLVVGSFCKSVGIRTVKSIQYVFDPV